MLCPYRQVMRKLERFSLVVPKSRLPHAGCMLQCSRSSAYVAVHAEFHQAATELFWLDGPLPGAFYCFT